MQKRWLRIVAAVVALFVLVVILVPFFVNADTFRPTLQTQLSSTLGRKITLGHLSFSLLKGSIIAEDITIADDPAFSSEPFLQAKSLSIGVQVGPLLFHRQVRITRLSADAPSIHLLHAADGRWNFSSIGGAAANQHATQESAIPDLTVAQLNIRDGSATVASVPSNGKQFVYSGINLTLRQFSFLKSFPFELSAKLPGSGTFELKGDAGPIAAKDAADTPFHATLTVKQFDPVASGVVDAAQGFSALIDIDAQAASDGDTLSSSGTLHATRLKLVSSGAPATKPVSIRYAVTDNLDSRTGKVSDLSVQTGAVAMRVTGGFRLTAASPALDLHLSAPSIPVDALEDLLPTVGIRLPPGSQLHGGTLTASLAITGTAASPVIAGPASIDNTKLAGFDLGSKIQGLNLFGGKGGGTDIQTLRATLRYTSQIAEFSDIYGNLPQLGTATGSGTVAPSGALDFKLNAKLNSTNAVGSVANQALNTVSSFTSLFHPKAKSANPSNNGIPLSVTGTTSNPTIRANVGAIFK
ncbi:MAG: AsmA family protein [Terracidiphilus sp.]|nr:AsmA family protein [Terracidiphilus sp.]